MKISALLTRHKGRDFYDVMFLLLQTMPDYSFLAKKCNINNFDELKNAIFDILATVDLNQKIKDFEHLVFNQEKSRQILYFREFINRL